MAIPQFPKVLIVDDDEDLRAVVREELEKASYYVMEAEDGKEALEVASKRSLDLILLDINLPDMTGYDVLKRLRKDPDLQSIPVILLTIEDEPRSVVLGLEMGAVDYVTKPYTFPVLFARIRSQLRRAFEHRP